MLSLLTYSLARAGGRGGITCGAGADVLSRTSMRCASAVRRQLSSRPPPQYGSTSVEIARFALLSVVSLPFAIWSAAFTYDYVYRVEIASRAIVRLDEDLEAGDGDDSGVFLGRERELAEVRTLLDQEPSQIVVIAGGNEAGKSTFVRELLRGAKDIAGRGVTLVQLAQLVDGVSSFTSVFVSSFDLRWLQLRHALVDVLPFAGSEILVMKERYSDRDLAQALAVVTDALKRNAKESGPGTKRRPVIVVDGLGEGFRRWMDSDEGRKLVHRLMQWAIYVTKERRLCHVVLTGSEHLVLSLAENYRNTRGHVQIVGLGAVGLDVAAEIVKSDLPDATDEEIKRITDTFGGFIHDVKGASRDIQRFVQKGGETAKAGSKKRMKAVDEVIMTRYQQHVERVVAAFAVARESTDSGEGENALSTPEDEDMDPYLDPLKSIYSEAASVDAGGNDDSRREGSWTQLQLWETLKRLVDSPHMAVPLSELRTDVFGGDKTPVLDLMSEDVLSFEVVNRTSDGGWFWMVTPASPALGLAFAQLVKNGELKERFQEIEEVAERSEEKKSLELARAALYHEKKNLDLRKKSLLQTIELGKEIGQEGVARRRLAAAFKDIVREEEMQDEDDRIFRDKLYVLSTRSSCRDDGTNETEKHDKAHTNAQREETVPLQSLLKSAVLDIASDVEGSGNEQYMRLKRAFDVLDKTHVGKISAEDVVRVVRESTGQDVSLSSAKQLVEEWDQDEDKSLDYGEFVQLILDDRPRSNKITKQSMHHKVISKQ